MSKAPSFQWYPNDWLGDVELQSACSATRGIWANALSRMWFAKERGELSGNEKTLTRLLNCETEEFAVFLFDAEALGFCEVSRDSNGIITLRNRRMWREEKERIGARKRQKAHYEKKKYNGNTHADLTAPSSSSSSSSSRSKPLRTRRARESVLSEKQQMQFDLFWVTYPKKKSKGDAEKAWFKINPSEQLVETMISTIQQAKTSEEWTKNGGQFIPYPATWLNAKGWEDEISVCNSNSNGNGNWV